MTSTSVTIIAPVKAKTFWQSKTFWANALVSGGGLIKLFLDADLLSPGTVAFLLGLGNILLRWMTTQPMEFVLDEKDVSAPLPSPLPPPPPAKPHPRSHK